MSKNKLRILRLLMKILRLLNLKKKQLKTILKTLMWCTT